MSESFTHCYCGDISTPLNMTRNKTKRDWFLYLSVIWPLGQALAIKSGQSSQTFSRQSEGLATRDYVICRDAPIWYSVSVWLWYWHFLPDRSIGQTRRIQIRYSAYTIVLLLTPTKVPIPASLSGMGTVGQQTVRPSSGQWTQLQRSLVPLSHPSWTFSLHDAPAKPTVLWRTPPTPPTLFQLLPSGRWYRSIRARSTRLLNSFFPQAVRALNSNHPPPPSETPCKPLPPESWTPPPLSKHPPTLPHQRKNCMKLFFVQFKVCYTQVSGPVQTTCSNTLSSMCTRHFSHTAACTQSHKSLSNICMFTCSCTTNHLALFPSQLLVSLCTCTVFMWSIRIVCIFYFLSFIFSLCIG